MEALEELRLEGKQHVKPLLAFISTTGISSGPEDVPWGLRWLYHYVLAVPHEDKKVMEAIYQGNETEDKEESMVFRGVVGVRPSLLFGTGDVMDVAQAKKVRVGLAEKPAVGYWIKRADVGRWIFKEVIERNGKRWQGEMVSLTY